MLQTLTAPTRPAIVRGLDGTILCRNDLPKVGERWVRSRKITLLGAIVRGLLTEEEAIHRYGLFRSEIAAWKAYYLEENDGKWTLRREACRGPYSKKRCKWRQALMDEPQLRSGGLIISPDTQCVTLAKRTMRLTAMEMMILVVLAKHPGKAVDKTRIITAIWKDEDDQPNDEIVQVAVCNMRRKMKSAFGEDVIETHWGIGYRLRSP